MYHMQTSKAVNIYMKIGYSLHSQVRDVGGSSFFIYMLIAFVVDSLSVRTNRQSDSNAIPSSSGRVMIMCFQFVCLFVNSISAENKNGDAL